jgi:predicted ATPase/DNA-binding SARP family transcriptional activator
MTAHPAKLEFRLLGTLEVEADGAVLPVGGPRQRALLAFLLLQANEPVRRERLVDALWGEEPPAQAQNSLQVAVHGLRKLLGQERIETVGDGYRLFVRPGELDLERFQELAGSDPAAALALWRGPALAGVEAPFARAEADRLEELRLAAVEARIESELESGAHELLVPELERLIADHPFRERLRGQLMLALYRAGRQAEALQAYQAARTVLVEELGIEPGPELQELERAILRQDAELSRVAAEETQLPSAATPLVGRDLELAGVTGLLRREEVRLVTLTGPGGTGKTRLALEAGHQLVAEFDRVVFVDLSALADAELVATTIAEALGVSPMLDAVQGAVRRSKLLLVLDNFERVLDAAPTVSELLSSASMLKVLVTSRALLRVSGEHEYSVPPLDVPEAGLEHDLDRLGRSESVRLFVARAEAARNEFSLTPENAPDVAGICRAVEGLPLALELAAARVRVLAPADLLERLSRRLDVLTGGPRDLPRRQQTLRATLEWSHQLLAPEQGSLYASLAVFAGGCSEEAAAAVCGAGPDELGALVEQSLLRVHQDEGRFSMLETVREHALERLEELDDPAALRRAHAEFFLRLAEEIAPLLRGPGTQEAIARLERENDNLRAALEFLSASGLTSQQLRLCRAIGRFWYIRGYLSEGRTWAEDALAGTGEHSPAERAGGLRIAGLLAWRQGDYDAAERYGEENLALARQLDDQSVLIGAVSALGAVAMSRDFGRARVLQEEYVSLGRELGEPYHLSIALNNLAAIEVEEGAHETAYTLYADSLASAHEAEARELEAFAHLGLGAVSYHLGRMRDAARHYADCLELFSDLGFTERVGSAYAELAALGIRFGENERAARLLGAAASLWEQVGVVVDQHERRAFDETKESVQNELGQERFEEIYAAGGRASPDALAAETLEVARGWAASGGDS